MSGGLKTLLKHADLLAAVAVVLVVVMMLVPLPAPLLDLLITVNIGSALVILITTMYVPRALDFAAFPSLLLLTTLLRLAINVSVTRLILLHGEAGGVIHAFGSFVVGGKSADRVPPAAGSADHHTDAQLASSSRVTVAGSLPVATLAVRELRRAMSLPHRRRVPKSWCRGVPRFNNEAAPAGQDR